MDLEFDQQADVKSNHPLRDGLAHMYGIPSRPSPQVGPSSQTPLPQPWMQRDNTHSSLPELHRCCVKGDLPGVLKCITDGCNVDEAVSLRNRLGHDVSGVTPLFLAAQRGFKPLCKLLIENGANSRQACHILATGEHCTPAQVAQQNLHILLAYYLRKQVSKRKEEDIVLALDDAPAPAPRLSTGLSLDFGGLGALFGAVLRSSGDGATTSGKSQGGGGDEEEDSSEGSDGVDSDTPNVEANDDGTPKAANVFMHELDLSQWDPCREQAATPVLDSQQMTEAMMKHKSGDVRRSPNGPQGVDARSSPNGPQGVDARRSPDLRQATEARRSVQEPPQQPPSVDTPSEWLATHGQHSGSLVTSRSTPVQEADLNGAAGNGYHTASAAASDGRPSPPLFVTTLAATAAEPPAQRANVKHQKMVKKFLKEVDFSQMILE